MGWLALLAVVLVGFLVSFLWLICSQRKQKSRKESLGVNVFSAKLTVKLFWGTKYRVRSCAPSIWATAISTNTQVNTDMGPEALKSWKHFPGTSAASKIWGLKTEVFTYCWFSRETSFQRIKSTMIKSLVHLVMLPLKSPSYAKQTLRFFFTFFLGSNPFPLLFPLILFLYSFPCFLNEMHTEYWK